MNSRRIIIVVIAILILGLFALGAYWLLRDPASPGEEAAGTLPEIGGEVALNEAAIPAEVAAATVPVTDVAAYRAFPDGTVIAVRGDGTISRIASTTVSALSATPVANFASASFSGDGTKILVLTGTQPRTQVNIFDVPTAAWRTVPGTFRDAAWGPRGTLLAILTPDPTTGKTAVGIYDAALGRTTQTVVVLALGDVAVSWPAPGAILVSDKPHARSTGSTWRIDVATRRVTLAARGGRGHAAVWNGDARSALALQAGVNGRGGRTVLVTDGVERAALSFTTIPDKCSFVALPGAGSSTTPYAVCGVPRDQDELQRRLLPDAWHRREILTDDVIVGVNLSTSEVDFTIAPPAVSDATQVQVVGTTVYYVDRATGALYHQEI